MDIIIAVLVIIALVAGIKWIASTKAKKDLSMGNYRGLIAAGEDFSLGVRQDGKLSAAGMEPIRREDWTDIKRITAFFDRVAAVRRDGTVKTNTYLSRGAINSNDPGTWHNIYKVGLGISVVVGLQHDGTVLASELGKDNEGAVSDWHQIHDIAVGSSHTLGLKSDGTVIATGSNSHGQLDVENWQNIIEVAAGGSHSVGLLADGRVVACGLNDVGQCDVKSWRDIKVIACGLHHTIGVKSDGTVVATGANYQGQCNVSEWKGIVDVCGGLYHSLGLDSLGSVVAAGEKRKEDNPYLKFPSALDVNSWKLFSPLKKY